MLDHFFLTDPADSLKKYRRKRKENGDPVKGGKNKGERKAKRNLSKFERGEFIALDGEGVSYGEVEKFVVGKEGKTYKASDHHYTLLAASSGESLYQGGKRLNSQDCIDFLLDLGSSHKRAIFVIFAGGYDVNHMLMFGFDRDVLKKISKGETYEYEYQKVWYSIEFRSRKSLTLKRHKNFVMDKEGDIKIKWKDKITVWDVFGFFQENFVGVMGKWLGKDYKHYDLIKKMKAMRGDFASVDQVLVNAYNAAELEALVDLMKKVRDAIEGLELNVRRWDGAGSIAAALFRKHGTKGYKNDGQDLERISEAVRTAYAGGRIEVCKIGYHAGQVYDYDLNSAYPSIMYRLPCLAHGVWIHGIACSIGKVPGGFTLVRCRFDFMDGLPFYPLFFRTEKMQISFPSKGEGWYWYPEFVAGLECPGHIEVLEYWHYKTDCDHKPFDWISSYYETRKQWVKNPDHEWQRGGEKIIKLGLNSLYGKTAQQLGGNSEKPPSYHQLEWAGYITSSTRAALYRAAVKDPDAIIGFATDGIFSIRPLDIDCSSQKEMGKWELKEPLPEGITIAMAGVYWWHLAKDQFSHFSRGFDKETMLTPHTILKAWQDGKSEIDLPMHRLIGMGSACASNDFFKMRGRFVEGFRTLRLDGKSHKRVPCNVKKDKPHKGLVNLEPSLNLEYGYELQQCSYPYPLKWLKGDLSDDNENDLEISRENTDTYNI